MKDGTGSASNLFRWRSRRWKLFESCFFFFFPLGQLLTERFSNWIIWRGGILVFSTSVVCVRVMVNQFVTYSFIVLMPIYLWTIIFSLFGVSWVIPNWFIELFTCWHGGVWCHTAASIWGAIPHCIVWTIWREQNSWIFEGEEQSIIELGIFILSLFKWITVLSGLSISSLFDFLDLCSFV